MFVCSDEKHIVTAVTNLRFKSLINVKVTDINGTWRREITNGKNIVFTASKHYNPSNDKKYTINIGRKEPIFFHYIPTKNHYSIFLISTLNYMDSIIKFLANHSSSFIL